MPSSTCHFNSWPHTPNPWGHVELVQKTWVLGSENWVRPRSAKSLRGRYVDVDLGTLGDGIYRAICRRVNADGPMPAVLVERDEGSSDGI